MPSSVLLNTYGPTSVPLTTPDGLTFNVATGQFGPGEFVSSSGSGSFSGENNAFNGYGRLYVGGSLFSPAAATYSTANGGQSLLSRQRHGRRLDRLPRSHRARHRQPGLRPHRRHLHQFHRLDDCDHGRRSWPTWAPAGHHGLCHLGRHRRGQHQRQWIGTDGNGTPAIITYIDGPLSLQPTAVSLNGGDLQWTFNITVAAGQTVNLAYFTIVAPTTPAAAIAAANVLVGSSGFGGQAGDLPEHGRTRLAGQFRQSVAGADAAAGAHRGRCPEQRQPLPLLRHQRRRNRQRHGHDHLGRRHLLDGDQHRFSAGCQIVVDPGGGFDVLGSHVYMAATSAPSRSAFRSPTAWARSAPATPISPWPMRRFRPAA